MEIPKLEKNEAGQNTPEVFLSRITKIWEEALEKLHQMDKEKQDVSKEEYEKIKEQAKLVAVLEKLKELATFYAEAKTHGYEELAATIETYLNL